MAEWAVKLLAKSVPKLSKPVLIAGLPGIGNVGKVAVDFMVEELKAEKLYEFFSYNLPHSVFVTEENLVELPMISLYFKKGSGKRQDILFLAGDVQPVNEQSCYSFSDTVLDYFTKLGGAQVITIGGIGLPAELYFKKGAVNVPNKPKVYCTGTSKDVVDSFKIVGVEPGLYGVVGPIIGVTGVLLGLSKRRKIPAISLLAETFSHPMYLGIRGAREVVSVLNDKLALGINIKELDREIREMESEAADRANPAELPKALRGIGKTRTGEDVSYIG
ncbi:PAC2 family protein [Candidatus Woesearchaeota archaeon]|nr:PAC2 family protein [Candidatus Woesearchaeota archaeon]